MKKEITITKTICDLCETNSAYDSCEFCSKDICPECERATKAVRYAHAVYFQGSNDGYYCASCDAKLKKSKKDLIYNAYRAITTLRSESVSYAADFDKRAKAAEERLRKLQRMT